MRFVRPVSVIALGFAATVLACGSRSPLTTDNGDAATGGDVPANGDTPAAPGPDGSFPGDDGPLGMEAGSPKVDANRLSDRFSNDGPFNVVPTDAAPPSPGQVTCGVITCNAASETCCASFSGSAVGVSCVPTGQPCLGLNVACDEKADCADGQVCCAKMGGGGGGGGGGFGGLKATCEAKASCTGQGAVTLCRKNEDCPADAPACCSYGVIGTTVSFCGPSC